MNDATVVGTPLVAAPERTQARTINKAQWIMGALLVLALLLAPFVLSDFRLSLLARFLCYAILALGLDLIWGYTGILSLGHGVYFGLGAYCMAMHLKLEATKGQMPDFMAWSGVDKMPWFWQPFRFAWFAIPAAIIVPTVLAAILGYCTFRSRIKGVFFSILSQALSIVVVTLFVGQQGYTGGTNGMTNYKTLFGYDLNSISTQHFFYWFTALALVGVYLLSRWLVAGRLGKILIAIRDGENRVRYTGYDPVMYKVFIYALSASLAGLAGILFVLQVGLITPTEMDIVHSIKMVLWVALGGRATLTGAVLGAVLVNAAENALSENYPAIWSFLMGGLFLVSVLFLPQGLMGWFNTLPATIRAKRAKKSEPRGWTSHASRNPGSQHDAAAARDTTDAAENPVY